METGHCKGFGFVQVRFQHLILRNISFRSYYYLSLYFALIGQFAHLEHAKAAQSLNGKLEIAGRTIKVKIFVLIYSFSLVFQFS